MSEWIKARRSDQDGGAVVWINTRHVAAVEVQTHGQCCIISTKQAGHAFADLATVLALIGAKAEPTPPLPPVDPGAPFWQRQ